jgi:undecaprenyl phosphate-alpha-L-ara4N flippase subunit ArnF
MTPVGNRGYGLAAASVGLTTMAQLAMKWGMSHLPGWQGHWSWLAFWQEGSGALVLVALGIFAYLLSMFCWLHALSYLPLSKAYPLLSLSYALVFVATLCLPWFDEPFALSQLLGVGLITFGVWLIVGDHSRS